MKYQDTSVPISERVDDLLGRMSIEEKITQLGCLFFQGDMQLDWEKISKNTPGHIGLMVSRENPEKLADELDALQKCIIENSRLKIPALIHIEAIAGGLYRGAASFPTSIAQASTWNPELVEKMADIIRLQLKAVGFRHALSPVFDIARDPRWGRLTETYGEDETLASAFATAYVRGLQGKIDTQAVAATGKHFVGHGITEGGLNMGQNLITERELREVHCKPFQSAITEADLMGVMNSYCSINREAIIGSKHILTDILRDEMKFNGILVSDYMSIDRLLNPFQVADNHLDAGIIALQAGLDVEYPDPVSYNNDLIAATKDGRLDPALIERSAKRVIELKFRLGLFDSPYSDRKLMKVAYSDATVEKTARQTSTEAITLLKNNGNLLPLCKKVKSVAVIGPHADRVRTLFGHFTYGALFDISEDAKNNARAKNLPKALMPDGVEVADGNFYQEFAGDIRETPIYVEDMVRKAFPKAKTFYRALCDYLPEATIKTARGISYTGNNLSGYDEAIACAAEADVVILTLGGQNGWSIVSTNGEGIDNSNIGLPGLQEQFAKDIRKLGKKTVVVHFDGKPLSSEYVATHFDAIIEAWQLGEFGFQSLVRVLFGDANPGGRLPLTVARGADRLPAYYGLPRGSGYVSAGRFGIVANYFGYVNASVHPLYYFGHGLSYTTFEYLNLKLQSKVIDAEGELKFSVDIKNTGDMDGDEVVQVYGSDVLSSMVRPDQMLLGFKRLTLKVGETKTIRFTIKMDQLAFLDNNMNWKVEGGTIELMVGASCVDIRLRDSFEIDGDVFVDAAKRTFYATAEC
ncbi:MAG: glycoside hydrolase family 3 C-terminal domain-containing protein [Oscillospiraceae bacterium]|nr:glycoside hydrolase family 3 C-terminal domain-containing protein [Oscillospiraceae bacterium]MCL2278370.1 glycoside hydrolase family 3 C-terminal domain-containing protein [Oscillospiraceae bacterium]